jgi:hypothetical protein
MEMLIGSDDFHLVADPIGRQINPAAVATGFDPLFDHFFTVYFEFHFAIRYLSCGIFFVLDRFLILTFFICHGEMPLRFGFNSETDFPFIEGLFIPLFLIAFRPTETRHKRVYACRKKSLHSERFWQPLYN